MIKETIRVDGMSCAACSARIEKALSKLNGISSVYANFSSNTVSVEYDDSIIDHDTVCNAIESAGYTVLRKDAAAPDKSASLKRSLILSVIFSIPLIILSMGPMFGLVLISDYKISSIVQLILCTPVIIAGRRFYIKGIPALISRSPTMDTLVSLGSGTAFVYSLVITVMMLCGSIGETHLYYESTAMILTLISVGKFLESRSRERTNDAVNGLKRLVPEEANVLVDGEERRKKVSELAIGDIMIIRPGERISADGTILEGSVSVDESMLTGESIPVTKNEGCKVFGGTLNVSNTMTAEISAVGEGTVLSGIIRMIEDAQSTKAPVARMADRVAARFVPAVISIAVIACIAWLIAGKDIGFALTVMISVLVISCPCAMGLATPLAITVGTGKAAGYGILFKNASSLEYAGRIDTVILDKTGTITEGKLSVFGIYPKENQDEILRLAASAEYLSEHPISKAIYGEATSRNLKLSDVSNFMSHVGSGVSCIIDGHSVHVGNASMMSEFMNKDSGTDDDIDSGGSTVVYVSSDGEILGKILLADTVRRESGSMVRSFNSLGVSVKMVTGDTESAAISVAGSVGITDISASSRPEDKVNIIKKLQATGHDVAMVGDGINDAPSLAQSDVGIAVGSGTDIAIDSADVVIMNDDVRNVPAAIEIGRATLKNIKENLFFAFCYNIVCIPIAAGLPYLFGFGLIESMPMIAAAAMSLSSLSVVSNALRLKGFRPRSLEGNPLL